FGGVWIHVEVVTDVDQHRLEAALHDRRDGRDESVRHRDHFAVARQVERVHADGQCIGAAIDADGGGDSYPPGERRFQLIDVGTQDESRTGEYAVDRLENVLALLPVLPIQINVFDLQVRDPVSASPVTRKRRFDLATQQARKTWGDSD